MSDRRLFLDESYGELRGVVTLAGRPERLLIDRGDRKAGYDVGACVIARVIKIERAMSSAFVDLGGGVEALMEVKPDTPRFAQGQHLAVEVRSQARNGKLALVRFLDLADGPVRLITAGPSINDLLRTFERSATITGGREARLAADLAEAEALETIFPLPGGGSVAVEATRALIAVDVDLGASAAPEAKRAARQANLAALGVAARILRLKGLGGLIVIDLVGRGHDGTAMTSAARAAFAPDAPGVAIGPIGRFGTIELTVPRRRRPVLELLLDVDGRLAASTVAGRLIRRLEGEGRAQTGARLSAKCSPDVAAAAQPGLTALCASLGTRFEVAAQVGWTREHIEVAPQ